MTLPPALLAGLGDSQLTGVMWHKDGDGIDLCITDGSGRASVLRCSGVRGLGLDLHFRRNAGGAPRSLDPEVEQLPDGRYSLHWPFPPQGFLTLECEGLELRTP
jgi:hypothetical protein